MHRSNRRQCHHPNLVHLHQIQAESFETFVLLTHGSHLGKIKAMSFPTGLPKSPVVESVGVVKHDTALYVTKPL